MPIHPGTPDAGRSVAAASQGERARLPGRFVSLFRAATLLVASVAGTLLAGPATTAAQGAMLVKVTSDDGPVAGASVELLLDRDVARITASDATGLARFVGLAYGQYAIRVEALGYQRMVVEDVAVETAYPVTYQVVLSPQPVQLERINVRADAVQIQRDNTDFSTTVDEVKMEMLPLAYEAAEVVALTPGARAEHVWGGANLQANSYLVDGLSANHPGLGGLVIEPSRLWIERVEVRGLGAGAEHGGFQGGQVNVVTKSGGNDFHAAFRTSIENDALTASNLVGTEIGSEVSDRYQVEGEVSGALIEDRLFFYLGGERVDGAARALNHLGSVEGEYAPMLEERTENKVFGKLTWVTGGGGQAELSGGYLDTRVDNYQVTGYQAAGATERYTAPTAFGNLAWHGSIGTWLAVEARLNHFQRDERREPYGPTTRPGIRFFAVTPPYTDFGNAPFRLRSAPSSTSGRVSATSQFEFLGQSQSITVGAEYTRGGFLDQRVRNGGMTWLPVRSGRFEEDDPSTWRHLSSSFTPTAWGGEVHLDADVANAAIFAQGALALGSRVVVTPGLRFGSWQGWLTPRDGERFQAVADRAWDPRIGLIVELDEAGSYALKGHWGRYHQHLMTQMFDRAAGGDVFSNEEIWYYRGEPLTDPFASFTEAERDALAEQGIFEHRSTEVLNETGPVVDYRQPYIDQWLVGFEKQFGGSAKIELLYTRRTNHDMVALVDRNRAQNYVRFERVQILDAAGVPLPFSGGTVLLPELYLPTWRIRERLQFCAVTPESCVMPPGFELADTTWLSWNPDYALTTAPDAERTFGQFQATVDVVRPTWGGSFSVAFTMLEGNLDNVSGYGDPDEYSAGPYVRVNEHVNSFGVLPNFSEKEAKVSAWTLLPFDIRGGLFFTYRSGDHYSPRFRMSGLGFYRFRSNYAPAGPSSPNPRPGDPTQPGTGDNLDYKLMDALEGHELFVGPRGMPQLDTRVNWDIRLARPFTIQGMDLELGMDLFNVTGSEAVTEVNPMVNNGRNYYAFLDDSDQITGTPWYRIPDNQYFRAVLERVRPRTLRMTVTARF
jgi:hypothetical protein